MTKRFKRRVRHAVTFAAVLIFGGCGSPSGLGTEGGGLAFIDGPVDHVVGIPIPSFNVWVVDVFGRRATGLEGGTLALDLLDPGGAVRAGDFATVPLSFGQGTIVPSVSLPAANGYSVRARYQGSTEDSPLFSVVAGPDVVQMTNPSAGEMGLIVDGANNIGRVRDSTHTTTTSQANVGVLNSGTLTHRVAVFAPDRRPELVPVAWTAAPDVVSIALGDPVSLPVTVWIISGSFANEKTQVELAITQLNEVWRQERAGVEVTDIQFMDATALAAQFEFFAVGMGAPFGALQTGVGRAAGRFNIYVVSQVRDGAGALVGGFGEQPGTAIAVTSNAVATLGPRALGHELGHNFGLIDTNGLEGFLVEPSMMTTGVTSTQLSEGQTFRLHFHRFSPLRLFRAGDAFDPPSCNPFEATADCPDLALRVWDESEPASISSSRQAVRAPRQ